MAAENAGDTVVNADPYNRFNEAAANGRGKLAVAIGVWSIATGFNEAAANGRGKQLRSCCRPRAPLCFNEAAANGRGKLGLAPERGGAVQVLQ